MSDHSLLFDHLLNRLDLLEARVNALEADSIELRKTLSGQSEMIESLSQRAIESDANMQKLISAVERLCERTEKAPESSFETHLSGAMKRSDSAYSPPTIFQERHDPA